MTARSLRRCNPQCRHRFGPAGRASCPFWLATSRLRSNFVAAEPPGTDDRDQQLRYPGNVGRKGGFGEDSETLCNRVGYSGGRCRRWRTGRSGQKTVLRGDLVRHTLENQKGPFCVLTSQFKRKEAVAWRIRVLETTGDVADDKVLKSVVVELGDGQKFPARYGPHPPRGAPPTDYFWSVHWR